MNKETDTRCSECKKKGIMGAMFSVAVSRLEEYFGHRVYECDVCHVRYKFITESQEVT